ncbi:hypothetical protein H7U37_06775 [Pseudoflavonifractor phocaeensis]|uniref:hypothetical protein n=1 Tax=Pseudoflavonifractor phocaeensis TaxID=1870988 RepID=UPI00195ED633|nr:hypothetical protein [Pseudoflavonifractor phocaeensis]MBM6870494.1 hypothetical protein [Pseudoflavonifractor phocaeensis]MBM6938239.1 hypothetical protein [Pseudoflavonifractor phocaeensis]
MVIDYTGWIVRSDAGHDKDGIFCVLGQEAGLLLLADGKRRKVSNPKKKKAAHVTVLNRGGYLSPAIQRIGMGEPVTDRALRRALAAFREELRRV